MKKTLQTLQMLLLCTFVSLTAVAQTSKDVQILELNSQQFKQKVWNFEKDKSFTRIGKLPIILDFHATWCGPCKMLAPHLQSIQNTYKGKLIVYKIDVDKEPELARLFKVQAMPTIVYIGSVNKYNTELGYRELNEVDGLVKTYFFSKK